MLIVPIRLSPVKDASCSPRLAHNGATSLIAANSQDLARSRGAGMFIPGTDASRWLAMIAEAEVPHHLLKLVVVPTSPRDRTPIGLLVILPQRPAGDLTHASEAAEEMKSAFPWLPHCIEYRCWFNQLWIPMSAELDVWLSEDQFLGAASPGVTYVWHPAAGLYGAEAAEVIGCAHLLRRPKEEFAKWSLAVAVPEINSRLRGIFLKQPPTFDSIMDSSREDIGESADQVDWRPKPPRRGGMAGLLGGGLTPVVGSVARLIVSLANRSPRTAASRTWVNDWEDWAKARLTKISDKLYQQQHKELLRLLDMLSNDPDRGLKFAFPMDSVEGASVKGAYRGLVPGGADLVEHELSFNLDRLRGGGLAAAWYVPIEIRQALIAKYRELAAREIALGRHMRAAYIYAQLLGDLVGAARVLESGKRYREAAALYGDKLQDRVSAVRCLELAGAWSEAISLLEALHMDERAGDLYNKLNQPERAAECYRRVVERHRSHGEYVAAAKIEEEKLEDRAAALTTLGSGFQCNQTVVCLREILRILAAGGQHSESRDWIERTRQHAGQMQPQLVDILRLLSSVSHGYPDPLTQHQAADTVRQLISEALAKGLRYPLQSLLEPLANLVPSDRLLSRDCRRYAAQRSIEDSESRARELSHRTGDRQRAVLLNTFRLHDYREQWLKQFPELNVQLLQGSTRWIGATPLGSSLFSVGVCGEVLVVQRVDWDGRNAEVRFFQSKIPVNESNLVMRSNSSQSMLVVTLVQGGDYLDQLRAGGKATALSWRFGAETECVVTLITPQHVATDLLGLETTSSNSWVQVRWKNRTLLLETVSTSGISGSQVIQHRHEIESLPLPVPMYYDGRHVLVATERDMAGELLIVRNTEVRSIRFPSLIRKMACSERHTRSRVALSLEQGVVYLSNNLTERAPQKLCPDFEDAKLQFIRTGHLIVASHDQCEIYDTKNDQLLCVGKCQVKQPFAILRTNKPEQFATISPDGEVCVYRVRLS